MLRRNNFLRSACSSEYYAFVLEQTIREYFKEFKVSIIIPVLNEERCLPTLLKSLEQQTCKDFEIIFVDGKSTDRTRDIIQKFALQNFARNSTIDLFVIEDATRNIGYIRNVGASYARGGILLQANADAYVPQNLIRDVRREFYKDNRLVCLTGRTFPLECNVFSHFAYGCFDLLRWLFINLKYPVRRISPSGNFMTVKADAFWAVGGFPHIKINEDGEFGRKLTSYCALTHTSTKFNLGLWIGHYADRFKQGSLKTIRFYLYVLGNFSGIFKNLFAGIEAQSAEKFAAR